MEIMQTKLMHNEINKNLRSYNMSENNANVELNMGTLYEVNKNLVMNLTSLKKTDIKDKIRMMVEYIEDEGGNYFMLLCHERRDYTVFNLVNSNWEKEFKNAMYDCLTNRGEVLDIRENEDSVIEIWLKIEGDSYVYFLFPYSQGIIEC